MITIHLSVVASACLLASQMVTHAACSPALSEQLAGTQRSVESLRPDKAGQMRVIASAASALHELVDALNAHHRAP